MDVRERIDALKRQRDAVVLAHYYVDGAVQDAADYVGDSFYLSKLAARLEHRVIVFAGVQFMGESAKLLSPDKTVYLPEPAADCPMAHMVSRADIERVRAAHPDVAVVCYVNSTAEVKSWSDVCVTSSNALTVVRALPNEHILFVPDRNLGSWVAKQVPEKTFHFVDGCCPVHDALREDELDELMRAYPEAPLFVHPECPPSIVCRADFAGSTAGIINAVANSDARDFIIGTVCGIRHAVERDPANAGKRLHFPATTPRCTDMDAITLEKVLAALVGRVPDVALPAPEVAAGARAALTRMLELA